MNHALGPLSPELLPNSYQTLHLEPATQHSASDMKPFVSESQVTLPNSDHPAKDMMVPESQVAEDETAPTIDVIINNVVSSFNTRCHLDLKKIAQQGCNVMYRRENGMVSMKLRRPYTTASIWSSGKITCTGARSEEEARIAARRFARSIQHLGYRVRFSNFRVVNVLGTCSFPFGIRITHFSRDHKENACYEPELHPGVTYKIKAPNKATLKIFSTGSVTVTAPCVRNVQLAIEHIFPLVYKYRMEDTVEENRAVATSALPPSRRRHRPHTGRHLRQANYDTDDESDFDDEDEDEEDDEDFSTDESRD